MKKFQVAYIPIGVPTFHLESAKEQFDLSISLLKELTCDLVYPKDMLLSIDDLKAFLDEINPSLVIVQNITFANSAYVSEVIANTNCDILLWTLREPVIDGGRLRLNSLTGAYSAGNAIKNIKGGNFEYVFGAPTEQCVKDQINATIKSAKVKNSLHGMKMTAIGHTPQGFGFGRAMDGEMLKAFGVKLSCIEARELIDVAKSLSEEDCQKEMELFCSKCCNFSHINPQNLLDNARLLKAYKDYVTKNDIKAIASRCWPDFFVDFGTPVCSVLSILNDLGVYSSCESDTFGALSMYISGELSGEKTFFGDPVSLDESDNTVTFWHCGMASCSLAKGEKANIGVHPNRKIGPVMDFACRKSEKATVFRVSKDEKGKFRFFIAKGEVVDKEKQFQGTEVVVKLENNCKEVVENSVKAGLEPHFVVAFSDISKELEILANMLEMDCIKF